MASFALFVYFWPLLTGIHCENFYFPCLVTYRKKLFLVDKIWGIPLFLSNGDAVILSCHSSAHSSSPHFFNCFPPLSISFAYCPCLAPKKLFCAFFFSFLLRECYVRTFPLLNSPRSSFLSKWSCDRFPSVNLSNNLAPSRCNSLRFSRRYLVLQCG